MDRGIHPFQHRRRPYRVLPLLRRHPGRSYVQIKDVSLVNQVPEDPRPRTLAGWEVEIQPLSPGVRPAVVEISGDPLVAQSMDVLVYEGSALSLRLLLGEEVDPNKAFFFDDQNLRMVGNLPYDQTGYLVDVEIPYEDGIPISLTMGPDYDTNDGMDMVTLYQSAQDLDAFVERIRNEAALYGLDMDCSWHYLDDQAAPRRPATGGRSNPDCHRSRRVHRHLYRPERRPGARGYDPVLRRGHLHRGGIRRSRGCHLRGRGFRL